MSLIERRSSSFGEFLCGGLQLCSNMYRPTHGFRKWSEEPRVGNFVCAALPRSMWFEMRYANFRRQGGSPVPSHHITAVPRQRATKLFRQSECQLDQCSLLIFRTVHQAKPDLPELDVDVANISIALVECLLSTLQKLRQPEVRYHD